MLPFTRDMFLDVFAAYNERLWPYAVVLWVLAAVVFANLVHAPQRSRLVTNILAVQWAWAGLVYHTAFFAAINPAAWVFAGLFIVQASLLIVYGYGERRIRFSDRRSPRVLLGWALTGYALLYPMLAIAEGHEFPRSPTFGLPCPTTILTIGALLAAEHPIPRALTVVPVIWALIGGSAAFLLDVRVDLMLPAAAFILIASLVLRPPVADPHAARHLT